MATERLKRSILHGTIETSVFVLLNETERRESILKHGVKITHYNQMTPPLVLFKRGEREGRAKMLHVTLYRTKPPDSQTSPIARRNKPSVAEGLLSKSLLDVKDVTCFEIL